MSSIWKASFGSPSRSWRITQAVIVFGSSPGSTSSWLTFFTSACAKTATSVDRVLNRAADAIGVSRACVRPAAHRAAGTAPAGAGRAGATQRQRARSRRPRRPPRWRASARPTASARRCPSARRSTSRAVAGIELLRGATGTSPEPRLSANQACCCALSGRSPRRLSSRLSLMLLEERADRRDAEGAADHAAHREDARGERPPWSSSTAFIAAVDIGDIVSPMPSPIRMKVGSR